MENEKHSLTPEESLDLISRTIATFKNSYRSNNFYFLLWGWIISIASISHFLILHLLLQRKLYASIGIYSVLNWGIFILAGITIQYLYVIKVKRESKVKSHLERYMSVLWQVSGAAMIFTGVICMFLKIYPVPFILTISGLSTMVTGTQIRFRPLIFGGIVMFAGAAISAFVQNEYMLLISAAAISIGYLIPGYMLKSSND